MIVSNSDIECAQKCERMFYYSRVLKITMRDLPVFLRRGTFGHKMMEHGFGTLIDGGNLEEATQAAAIPLTALMESDDPEKAELMKVYRHVVAFLSFSQQADVHWRPVALEEVGMWNLSTKAPYNREEDSDADLVYAFTPDIIVEFTKGVHKGQQAVLDYKFLAQYMSQDAINMSQQPLKYLIYRNKIYPDSKIRHAAYVQLNTRATATDVGHKLFLIKWMDFTKQRLERVEYENELWIQKTAGLYSKQPNEFLRTVNKDVCDRCFFTSVCAAEFDGKPEKVVDKIIEREYRINDYGY